MTEDADGRAEAMVESQIRARGVRDRAVLEAMSRIPRGRFVQAGERGEPYGDHPLPIGHGQTISQPYMVAYMTEKLDLQGQERVLEIGTGSGYQTAVLAEICRAVYTIERIPALLRRAKLVLGKQGYRNIYFRGGDGSLGWEEEGPFDRILVTAAVPAAPPALKKQLADDGLLVVPVGDYRGYQLLQVLRRRGNRYFTFDTIGCRFVPLLGEQGF